MTIIVGLANSGTLSAIFHPCHVSIFITLLPNTLSLAKHIPAMCQATKSKFCQEVLSSTLDSDIVLSLVNSACHSPNRSMNLPECSPCLLLISRISRGIPRI